jgi:hypothetical protein
MSCWRRSSGRMFRFTAKGSVSWTGSHMGTKFVRTVVLRKVSQMRTNGAASIFRDFQGVSTECYPVAIVIPPESRNCSVIR